MGHNPIKPLETHFQMLQVLIRVFILQVRLEGTPPTQLGRILFCTTGILLRRMQNNALLQGTVVQSKLHKQAPILMKLGVCETGGMVSSTQE